MAPITASLIVSMASPFKHLVASSLINAIAGKIAMRVRKGQTSELILLLTLPLMMKSYLKRSPKSRKKI